MAEFRILVDESGTHASEWLIIGMLFVPDHGLLHSELLRVKKELGYLNRDPRRKATYKECHLSEFRSDRDVEVARRWIDLFVTHDCWFRSLVFEWSLWDGSNFGSPFEPDALKKRRAYKKWAELLLQPELSTPLPGRAPIRGAKLYLDHLAIAYRYDVLDGLEARFTSRYRGKTPFIQSFAHTDSWRDANQTLQLCDLLVGGLYQALVPSRNGHKLAARDHLERALQPTGVKSLSAGFFRGFHHTTLRERLPKYSAWFWLPERRR